MGGHSALANRARNRPSFCFGVKNGIDGVAGKDERVRIGKERRRKRNFDLFLEALEGETIGVPLQRALIRLTAAFEIVGSSWLVPARQLVSRFKM